MKRRQEKSALVLPILMLFITIVLLIFGSGLFNTTTSTTFAQLDAGWTVSRGGEVFHDVKISELRLDNMGNDETVVISNTIPVMDTPVPALMF